MVKIQRGSRIICPDDQLRANLYLFEGSPRFQHRQWAFQPGKIMISRSVCQMHFVLPPRANAVPDAVRREEAGREFPAVFPLLPCFA
jgi:hypothetical protein